MMHWFDVHGLRLTIEAETLDLIAPVRQYVDPFATDACSAADYSIVIERGFVDELPDGATVLSESPVAPGVPSRLAIKDEQNWLLVPGQMSVVMDRAAHMTRIRVGDECGRSLQSLAGIHAIEMALASSGQHLLHGAALTLPGDPLAALLVFAPSGAGKTTTALALALGGFGLLTDDAIVLQPRGYRGRGVDHVWGLPRSLKIHRRTAELLPAIAPLLTENWDPADEQPLRQESVSGLVSSVPPFSVPISVPIVAIATLGQRSGSDHQIVPLDKAKALVLLAHDNMRRSKHGVTLGHAKRFEALGALLAVTPSYEMRVGAHLMGLPEYIAATFNRGYLVRKL